MAFTIKRSATRPTYVAQLIQNVGTPQEGPIPDLDTADDIVFVMRAEGALDDALPDVAGSMTLLDPVEAIVEYPWVISDTRDTPSDNNQVEVWIIWAPGMIEILPNDNYKVVTLKPSLNYVPA